VSGTVHMQFKVNKNGDVVDVKVVKGVHPDLDNEAIRVIKSSPKWEAGKQRGRAVNVIMSLPMKFILQ
jgi:protein TonB